jgi:hypothetical protein
VNVVGRVLTYSEHRLNASSRWSDAEKTRGLAALHAAPEFLFRRQQEVLVEGIGGYFDLDPFASSSDDGEHRSGGIADPHIMLDLRHVLQYARGEPS